MMSSETTGLMNPIFLTLAMAKTSDSAVIKPETVFVPTGWRAENANVKFMIKMPL
jgi:hypothetical protein